MKSYLRGWMNLLFAVVFTLILIRAFPFVVKIVELGAMGIRQFWWIVLIFALSFWFIHFMRKSKIKKL